MMYSNGCECQEGMRGYVDGAYPFQQAGLSGYANGPYPFEDSGLRGMGFEFGDLIGGFSGQTVLLGVGAMALLFVLYKSGSSSWDKGAQKIKARRLGGQAKKKVDDTVGEILNRIDKGDKEFETRMNFLESVIED